MFQPTNQVSNRRHLLVERWDSVFRHPNNKFPPASMKQVPDSFHWNSSPVVLGMQKQQTQKLTWKIKQYRIMPGWKALVSVAQNINVTLINIREYIFMCLSDQISSPNYSTMWSGTSW